MQRALSPRHHLGRQAAAMVAVGLIILATATQAADQARSYRFEVVDQPVAVGAHSEFTVKLTKDSTGQPVENAKITPGRLEMTMTHPPHKSAIPGPMATAMAGEAKFVGTPSPGLYRFMGDLSMPGTWTLDLVAVVPGEAEPIKGTTTFKAGR